MKKYVLITIEQKEGVKEIIWCDAKDIDDAIEKFGWYPFEKPVTTSQKSQKGKKRQFMYQGKIRLGRSWEEVEEKFGGELPAYKENGLRVVDPVGKPLPTNYLMGEVPTPLDDEDEDKLTFDRVRAFYGLDDADPYQEGNGFEDEDQYVILEISKDDVNQYGAREE